MLSIILFLIISNVASEACVHLENLYIKWTVHSPQQTVTFGKHSDMQWIGVGFNTIDHITANGIFFIYNGTHLLQVLGSEDGQSVFLGFNSFKLVSGDPFWSTHVEFEIPNSVTLFNSSSELQRVIAIFSYSSPLGFPPEFGSDSIILYKNINMNSTENECMWATTAFSSLLGINDPVMLSIQILYSIIVIILCAIFHTKQPLKSRGWVPIMTMICLLGHMVRVFLESNYFLTREWHAKYQCFFAIFFARPVEYFLYFLIVVHELRFLLILNLNNTKQLICRKRDIRISIKLQILKFFASPWISILLVWMLCMIYMLIDLIFLATHGFNCSRLYNFGIFTIESVILRLVLPIIVGLELLFDIISNYKLKCNLYKYFISQDIFYFRREIFSVFLIAIILIVLLSIRALNWIVVTTIITIVFHVMTGMLSLFPLFLTWMWEIKKRLKKTDESKQDTSRIIDVLLNDELGHELFVEFAKQEWSIENVMIYDEIQQFNKTFAKFGSDGQFSHTQELYKHTKQIYEKYLATGSVFEVNIDRATCNEVWKKLSSNTWDGDTFKAVEITVKGNLSDTFSRFKETEKYKIYVKNLEQKQELEKKSGIV